MKIKLLNPTWNNVTLLFVCLDNEMVFLGTVDRIKTANKMLMRIRSISVFSGHDDYKLLERYSAIK